MKHNYQYSGVALLLLLMFCNVLSAQVNVDSLYDKCRKARGAQKSEIQKKLIDYFVQNEFLETKDASSDKNVMEVKVGIGLCAYWLDQAEFQKSVDIGLQAEKRISMNWKNGAALAFELYGDICTSYFRLGQFDKAFDYAEKQYAQAKKANNADWMSSALNNLACLYLVDKRYNEAEKYISQAVALDKKHHNTKSLAAHLGIKSEVLLGLNKFQESLDCINEAVELERKAGRMVKVGIRLSQKGDVQMAVGACEEAIQTYEEALRIFEKDHNPISQAITLKQLGSAKMRLADYHAAETYMLKCNELCQQYGFKQLQYNVFMCLHNLYKEMHQTEKALFYCEQYAALYDTLQTDQHKQQVSEFEVKYKTQEKEVQLLEQQLKNNRKNGVIIALAIVLFLIVLLTIGFIHISKERKNRNIELEKLNKTKNRLFSIISHDLKNSVFAQKRMMDLLDEHFDSFSPDEVRMSVSQLKNNTDTLTTLLQDLLQWASIDGGRVVYTPIRLNLNNIVENSIAQQSVNAENKKVAIRHYFEKDIFVMEDAHFVEFILRNLLSNAIKFSYPGSEVEIKVKEQNGWCELSVIDHGVGMCDKQLEMLFKIGMVSSKGTSGEAGSGLGLMVCKEMMDRSGGRIWAESEEGKSTAITFTMKL